jgi:hypothetical protein
MFDDNSEGNILEYGKIAITTDHFIYKVYLLILWTTIYCQYHNFVRWVTIVYSLVKV